MDWKMFALHNGVHYKKEIENSVENSKVFSEKVPKSAAANRATEVAVADMKTLEAFEQYRDGTTCILDFASYKYPGGGFLRGARAQEEYLCQNTTLYNVLATYDNAFYRENRADTNYSLYKDRALYVPSVVVLPSEKTVDILVCAAPNRSACRLPNSKNREALENRIEFILDILQWAKCDTVILGAFGCGVFGQDPEQVAEIFKEKGVLNRGFKKVVFAIPKGVNHEKFKEVFND